MEGRRHRGHRDAPPRRAGLGTKVRQSTLDSPGTPPAGLNRWQALVWREVQRRQSGVGILATSWLLRRWRSNSRGRYLSANKTGQAGLAAMGTVTNESREFGTLARVEQRPGSLRLTGMTPGMAAVADRYGIVGAAVGRVMADMMPYIRRKMEAEARILFPKAI